MALNFEDCLERNLAESYPAGDELSLRRSTQQPVKSLRPDHYKILLLHSIGFKNYEIAEMVPCSESHVSITLNRPDLGEIKHRLIDEYVNGMTQDARNIMQATTREAAVKLVDFMRKGKGAGDALAYQATQSILDRGGVPKTIINAEAKIIADKSELDDLRQALRDIQMPIPALTEVSNTHEVVNASRELKRNGTEPSSNGAGQSS